MLKEGVRREDHRNVNVVSGRVALPLLKPDLKFYIKFGMENKIEFTKGKTTK